MSASRSATFSSHTSTSVWAARTGSPPIRVTTAGAGPAPLTAATAGLTGWAPLTRRGCARRRRAGVSGRTVSPARMSVPLSAQRGPHGGDLGPQLLLHRADRLLTKCRAAAVAGDELVERLGREIGRASGREIV